VSAVLLCACGGGSQRPPGFSVRDSLGITIVENIEPAWQEGEGWRLSEAPIVHIGVVEGDPEYQLFGSRSSLRMDDGSVVVANTGTQEIRWYDSGGQFVRSAGGAGGGPGEFSQLIWIGRLGGDSIIAFDDRRLGISVFDAAGTFCRSLRVGTNGGLPQGAFPDGSLLIGEHIDWTERPTGGRIRPPARAYRLSGEGEILDTLGVFPSREFEFRFHKRDGRVSSVSMTSPPFGRATEFAIGGDGFFAGSQDDCEIAEYDQHGVLAAVMRWPCDQDRVVTQADIDAYGNFEFARTTSDAGRRSVEEFLEGLGYPEQLPAFGAVLVDGEGNLWVEEYNRDWDDRRRWTVFDSELRMLGTVDVPPEFILHQVSNDFVLGYGWDELDVEYIRVYELIKT
jgi:hypothetical protein